MKRMSKLLALTAVLALSSAALAQSALESFDPKTLGSNPFALGGTVALGTAFIKERLPGLKGWGVVATSFGLSVASSAALYYSGNGGTVGQLEGVLGWLAFAGLTGLVASGAKDFASSLLGVLGGKKAAQVVAAPGVPGTVPSSAPIVPRGGVGE